VPEPREVHRTATRLLSAVMVLLGVVLIVLTVAGGGGPLSLGILLGVLFVLAGVLRLRVERGLR
jgi:hypothetical protein